MLCGVVNYIISYNGFFVKRFFQKKFSGKPKSFLQETGTYTTHRILSFMLFLPKLVRNPKVVQPP